MSAPRAIASLVRSFDGLRLRDGVFTADLGDTATADSWVMSFMRSPLLARVYEATWRPAVVRAFSTLTYADEDAIVDRYLEGRENFALLDLCCGTAHASRRLIPRGADVLGIDASLAMLREARRRCPSEHLTLVQSDASSPIAEPERFDAVFCFAALHLLERPDDAIHAVATALRPGGLFFAWVATSSGILGLVPLRTLAQLLGLRVWRPRSLAARMREHGIEVLETLNFGAVEFVVGRRCTPCT